MIATIVKSVLRARILWERPHTRQPRLDEPGFTQRPTAYGHTFRHFFLRPQGLGKIPGLIAHHFFREREDRNLKPEQILHRIIVLKTVHTPHRRGCEVSPIRGFAQEFLEFVHRRCARFRL